MSLRRDLRHGARIGRAEFVRSLRGYTKSTRRVVGLGLALVIFGSYLLLALPAVYAAGQSVGSVPEIPLFGGSATVLPVVLVALAALRTIERIGSIESEELMLLTVHPRAVVVGLITAEIGRLAVWFGVPVVVVSTVFALGVGAPSLLFTTALVAAPLVCAAAVWGYAAGVALLRLFRRVPTVRRALKVSALLSLLVFVVAAQSVGRFLVEDSVSVAVFLSDLALDPMTDYVALAFVGTPLARPLSGSALLVFVALLGLVPVGIGVATRQATALWFTDVAEVHTHREQKIATNGFTAPSPLSRTKSGQLAWGYILRGVRHPQQFSHLIMIAFFVGPVGSTISHSSGDALGPLLAGVGVGIGTYLAGATFGLNPLGDDRPQFPVLLLTETTPRTIVRSRVLAGLVLGVPVAAGTPLLSVALGTRPIEGVVLGFVGIGTCLAAAAFAVGIGSSYPVYDEREFWGATTVVPSTLVMLLFIFVVGPGTVIGLVVAWYLLTGHLTLTTLLGVGLGVYLVVAVGASYGSYRYAIRRYRTYSIE